ncbi:MAG: monovalent cation/H+ antiporter complex subunit F [Campylobacterota bacterium]|nr:monovalent cation/H+ antiporter complex subunit F [Campylobacterota bacterium]
MFYIITIILFIAISISLYRFILGPTLSDRVVAFDVIGIICVSFLVILALHFQRMLYLDIALVFGLIGFLGTTLFGRFIEKGI